MRRSLLILAMLAAIWMVESPARAGDSTDVEPTLEAIQMLQQGGKVQEAAVRASQLVAEHPEVLDAHLVHQDTQLALGHADELLRDYRERTRSADATADDHYLLARLLSGSDAVKSYRDAIDAQPKHFWALCGLGAELTSMGKTSSALEALETAEAVDPASGVPPNLRGRVEEARGRFDDAEALYKTAIERQPDLTIARVNLGVLLAARGRNDEAMTVLDAAVKQSKRTPDAYLARGMTHLGAGRSDAAVRDFETALNLDTSLVSLTLLANAYLSLERHELARKAIDRALEINATHAPTHVISAYAHLAKNEFPLALAAANRAADLDDKLGEAYHMIGLCHERGGDLKKAEAAYKRAVKLDTSNPTFVRALALFYEARAEWKDAVKEYTKVVKLTDGAPSAWFDLALAQWNSGKHDKAAKSLESLLDADPEHLDGWLNLGILCHHTLKKRRKAISAYREYIALGGTDDRVPGWLADLER